MLRYLYSLSKLCMCTEVHARKGIRFAQSFLESICRGFIVYIKPPAVCGVFSTLGISVCIVGRDQK